MKQEIDNLEFNFLLDRFKRILRENGLKYTKQREVLLEILYNSQEHFTPDDLYFKVKTKYPELNVGIATVYRTLNLLEDSGMATSISFGIQGKKFELANKPHHDHIICKNCGKIVEFEDLTIEKKQIEICKKHKFKMTSHIMQLYGVCDECNINKKG